MDKLFFYIKRIFFLFTFLGYSIHLYSQAPKLRSTSWRDNWSIDVKSGVGILISSVSYEYLKYINFVNLPVKVPGVAHSFNVRKSFSPHFETGYQFDYIQVNGKVVENNVNFKVSTQAFESNFWLGYNFKPTNIFRPRFNFMVYYKVGGISMKNNPRLILDDGSLSPISKSSGNNEFLKNIAVLTGFGLGASYQFMYNISLITTFELNRSSDMGSDIYKFYKILYNSPNTVNKYMTVSAGLSYNLNFPTRKKSSFYHPKTMTDKRLRQIKIVRSKRKSSKSIQSVWYKH